MDGRSFVRVHFIDWLRIFAVLLLFPFHVLRVFDSFDPFYVKADAVSHAVGNVLWFIGVWHMPLLFFLAGCSTYFALRKRTTGRYALERVTRLLVPLIFGTLILIPPQTWFGGRFNSGYSASYGHYLVSGDFLKWNIQDGGDYFGGFGIGQLWFILFLFIISLVVLPLVMTAARGRARGAAERFSRWLARPVWWLLPVVLFFLADEVPEIAGQNFVYYLLIFLFGFFTVCHPAFMEAAKRYRWPALAVGVGLSLFWVLGVDWRESFPDPGWERAVLQLLAFGAVWLMIVGLLGFGKRYLDRPSAALSYLAEASYPVYILHQTVIVILGFYVVQMGIPVWTQAVVLLVLVLAGTFALYEIVRRVLPLRVLFGMKARRSAGRSPQAEAGSAGAGGQPSVATAPAAAVRPAPSTPPVVPSREEEP